ncbi:MAG: RluA family pseudouridine synthase [Patescibacteria group bacterium]
MKKAQVKISREEAGKRIDLLLAQKYPEFSRAYFQFLIKNGHILINGQGVKPQTSVKTDDQIEISFLEKAINPSLAGEEIPLNIIFENEDVLVVNKQAGLVTHPAAGNLSGTLVNALVKYLPSIKEIGENATVRPGLVHRLDKDTSGVMIIAKNSAAMAHLTKEIKTRSVRKIYWALCFGWPKNEQGEIISHLARHPRHRQKIAVVDPKRGREAISCYRVIEYLSDAKGNRAGLIEFNIKTGRTHQIRVQGKSLGHPILGDSLYGSKSSLLLSRQKGIGRQMLHAKSLSIRLPDETNVSKFEAELPTDFKEALARFKEG